MNELPYPPLLLADNNGTLWKETHRQCQQQEMVPTININGKSGAEWWWYCQPCGRFVRPLNQAALTVVNRVLGDAMAEKKKKWAQDIKNKRRRKRK